jgi:Tfp pilus assembly protein PilF
MRAFLTIWLGSLLFAGFWLCSPAPLAQEPKAKSPPPARPEVKLDKGKLPLSGRPPAKLVPDLCLLRYRVSTDSPECQALFNQGLAWFYSYVYGDAAQSFETALLHDADCAMAWWGLSRALFSDNKPALAQKALENARSLQSNAAHPERLLITALAQSKAPLPGTLSEAQRAADKNRLAAIRTIDELLSLYDEDEEGWFLRAKLEGDGVAAVPFYKALVKINPLHPGATHELVHHYDRTNRPLLAWPYTENYIKGSPGVPHAYHMQVDHIALRLGRWDKVLENAPRAGEFELLTLALIHEGRFQEARGNEAAKHGNRQSVTRFLLHAAERKWDDARAVLGALKADEQTAQYLRAVYYLKQENPETAAPFVRALREALQRPADKTGDRNLLENRTLEAEGMLLCQQGEVQAGLALLAKLRERTKNVHRQMGWAHGAQFDELHGIAALKTGQDETAEEALQHALAHDSRSARGALGMQVLCERQGRNPEAKRFEDLARRIWAKADPGVLDAELTYLRQPLAARNGPKAK